MNNNDQRKTKLIRNFSLQFISISTFLTLCILINIFLYHQYNKEEEKLQLLLLNLYAEEVERLILKDFQKVLAHDHKTKDFSIIKNFTYKVDDEKKWYNHKVIYLSNNVLHVNKGNEYLVVELSNIKKILDDISKNLFFYTITINKEQILTNTISGLVGKTLSINHRITKDTLLNISLQHYKQSKPVTLINANIQDKIFQTLYLSISIFFVGVGIILWFLKQRRELMLEKNLKNNILLFANRNKDFIVQCYEYSKKFGNVVQQDEVENEKHKDYLPLSIAHEHQSAKKVDISIDKIVESIKSYFVCYQSYYQVENIKLKITFSNLKQITVPFDYEVFYQILVSIIYNLMNFNKKSSKARIIEVNFKKAHIIISSDGLKLNKEYAIKASEMIFQDTANPYLINFGQIFVLLNRYNIKSNVSYKNDGTIITISLPFGEVINLNMYKKTRKR